MKPENVLVTQHSTIKTTDPTTAIHIMNCDVSFILLILFLKNSPKDLHHTTWCYMEDIRKLKSLWKLPDQFMIQEHHKQVPYDLCKYVNTIYKILQSRYMKNLASLLYIQKSRLSNLSAGGSYYDKLVTKDMFHCQSIYKKIINII